MAKDYKTFNGSLTNGANILEELQTLRDKDITTFTLTDSCDSMTPIIEKIKEITTAYEENYNKLCKDGNEMQDLAKRVTDCGKVDWFN